MSWNVCLYSFLHLVGEQFSFNFVFVLHFRAFLVVVKAVRIPWVLLVAFAEDQAMFWIQIDDRAKVRYVSYCTYTYSLYLLI